MKSSSENLTTALTAQRYFILALEYTKLDENQRKILESILEMNVRLTNTMGLKKMVPSMGQIFKNSEELSELERLWSLEEDENGKEGMDDDKDRDIAK